MLCAGCLRNYEAAWTHRSGMDVLSGGPYTGGLRRAILRLKDSNDRQVARLLGQWLSGILRPLTANVAGIVPVPTSRRRRRWRGYCAPSRLAAELSTQLSIPVGTPLICPGDPAPRKQLKGFEGRRSVVNKFQARASVQGTWILLDDVVTSGQTLVEARDALLGAGAAAVLPVVIARSY